MRAGAHGVRRFRLLAVLVALCLVGVAGTATAQPARDAGASSTHSVSVSHSSAWQLPRALPERLEAQHQAPPDRTTGHGVVPAAISHAGLAASSYQGKAVAACCGNSVPAWAGRAPPPLL